MRNGILIEKTPNDPTENLAHLELLNLVLRVDSL